MTKKTLQMIGFNVRNRVLFENYFENVQSKFKLVEDNADIKMIDLDTLEGKKEILRQKSDNQASLIVTVSIDEQDSDGMFFIRKPLTINDLDACFSEVSNALNELGAKKTKKVVMTDKPEERLETTKSTHPHVGTTKVVDGLCSQIWGK